MADEASRGTSSDVQRAKIVFGFLGKVVDAIRTPLKIASFWLPLYAVQGVFHEIAGKETKFNFAIKVAATASVALIGAGWAAVAKMLAQRKEIKRQREVIAELEEENAALRTATAKRDGKERKP